MNEIIKRTFLNKLNENDLIKLKKYLQNKKEIKSIFNYKFQEKEFNNILESLFSEDIYLKLGLIFTKDEIDFLTLSLISEDIKLAFDGKFQKEELEELRKALISEKDIQKIEFYLEKYKDYLTGYRDLVGDNLVPNMKLFLPLLNNLGYLLQNNPDLIYSKDEIKLRKTIYSIVKIFGKKILKTPQIIENRNFLISNELNPQKVKADKKIILPDSPVIWTSNHGFKDDAMASLLASHRHSYLVFGALPYFFNTLAFTTWLTGVILCNRKLPSSRESLIPKANKVMNLGADILIFSEAAHNRTLNQILLELWPGIIRLAKENNSKIVPIVHYFKDPTYKMTNNIIHTVVDDPIDLNGMSEQAALTYLRDIMASWYQLMNEKYGKMSREELLKWYEYQALSYNITPEELTAKPLTTSEAFLIYLNDLKKLSGRDDSEIEKIADFRDKNIIRPEEAYSSIAKIKSNPQNVFNVIEAANLVRTRKNEDFQRRLYM